MEKNEAEMKRNRLSPGDFLDEEIISAALKKLSVSSLDEMYAAIGYGGMSTARADNRFREEVIRSRKQQQREKTDKLTSGGETPPAGQSRPVRGIVVQGVDNCLIKFARCCTPVPGDKVVGFITKGYGISVHRAECLNCLNSRARGEDDGRWIDVGWGETNGELYTTSITMNARDRNGLIVDVATVLNAAKVKILSMNMRETGGGKAVAMISLEVPDNSVLASVMSRLSLISGVVDVSRPGV